MYYSFQCWVCMVELKAFSFSLCWRCSLPWLCVHLPFVLRKPCRAGFFLPSRQQHGQWLMYTEDSCVFSADTCIHLVLLPLPSMCGCSCLSPSWGEVSIFMPRESASLFLHMAPNGNVKKGSCQVLPPPCWAALALWVQGIPKALAGQFDTGFPYMGDHRPWWWCCSPSSEKQGWGNIAPRQDASRPW